MAPIFLSIAAFFFAISPVHLLAWDIGIKGNKYYDTSLGEIYEDKDQGILLFINSCDRSERADLEFSDNQILIRLIKEECEVDSVYKAISPDSLKRKNKIIKEKNDWYRIGENDTYIRTKLCFQNLFTEEEATLEIAEDKDFLGRVGQLIFENGNRCEILGVYKNLRNYDLQTQGEE